VRAIIDSRVRSIQLSLTSFATYLPASNQSDRFQPLSLPGLFSIQVFSTVTGPKECDCLAATLLSAFADRNSKLATTQSVSLANQIHDCVAVLKPSLHPPSVGQLSPVTTHYAADDRSHMLLANGLPEDMFPHLPPQIAAHGFRRLTASQSKLLSQLWLLPASQRALTL